MGSDPSWSRSHFLTHQFIPREGLIEKPMGIDLAVEPIAEHDEAERLVCELRPGLVFGASVGFVPTLAPTTEPGGTSDGVVLS